MTGSNKHDSRQYRAVDWMSRFKEGRLCDFIEKLAARAETTERSRQDSQPLGPPIESAAPEPELPASPKQDAGGTEA